MNSIIKSIFEHTPLMDVVKFFKTKELFIVIPIAIPIILFIIYMVVIWISIFVIVYENGFSFYKVLEIAAGQWAEFVTSYIPNWLYGLTSWIWINGVLIALCGILSFIPTMLALMWGFLIIIRGMAYLIGFLGHIFLFLKKLILDQ